MDIRCWGTRFPVAGSIAALCLTLLCATLSIAATPPALSNPNATPEAHLGPVLHGVLPGQASVGAAGNASYIIPIELPPGTHGMAPNLSLNYHSGVNNGLLGVGWFVQGLTSKIMRCPQTIVQDGQNRAVDLSAEDRFCMDGHRLLAVNGTYGADGAEYRAESDEFSRIISHGGTTGNPDYWTVERNNGLTLSYGGSGDSKLEAPGETAHVVWYLNRSEDELGNYYAISYTRAATVTTAQDSYARPDRIDYTGNSGQSLSPYASVRFEYEERDDVERKYNLTGPISTDKRMSHIKTYVGETLVRGYQFSYEYSASTALSRLASLKQCSWLANCTEATDFGWSDDGVSFTQATDNSIQATGEEAPLLSGDFNGDGLTDVIVRAKFDGSYYHPAKLYHAQPGGTYGGFVSATGNVWEFQTAYDYSIVSGDFNGDGRSDVFVFPYQNVADSAYVLHADSNGVFSNITQEIEYNDFPTLQQHQIARYYSYVLAVDVNGDGRDDLILLPAGSGESHILLADINGHFNDIHDSNFLTAGGSISEYYRRYFAGDFNGDGKIDLLFQDSNYNNPQIAQTIIYYADETGKFSKTYKLDGWASGVEHLKWFSKKHKLILGDYNGDGRTDILMRAGDYEQDNHLLLANEAGEFSASSIKMQSYPNDYLGLQWHYPEINTGDFNGDGRTDLFVQQKGTSDGGTILLAEPDGTFLSINQDWGYGYLGVYWPAKYISFNVGDYNGDGRSDLLQPRIWGNSLYGKLLYANPNQPHPDHLTSITNGLGATTTFAYKPLTDDTVYTKGTSATYPDQDIESARYVVSELKQADGIGGNFVTSYTYAGAKRQLTGRGDLGFAKITAVDQDRNSTTITEYEQTFPFSRLPKRVEVRRSSDNRLLSSTDTTYQGHGNLQTGPVFPYVATRVGKQYALVDGRLLSTTTTTNHCDEYGNITDTTTLVNDHETNQTFQTQTLSSYNIDTLNWRVGQKLTETVKNSMDGINDTSLNVSTGYSYDNSTGLPLSMTRESGSGAPLELTTTYAYDGFGNATSQTISGPGIASRTTTTAYDSRGQFPITVTNALNHQESRSYDDRFGKMISQTGPNGLTTTWQLNDFGQVTLETRADGTVSSTSVHRDNSGSNPNAVFYSEVLSSGAGPVRSFHDSLGRVVRSRSQSFDGSYLQQDTEYDNQGRTKRTSEPYFVGSTRYWNTPSYDHLGRITALDSTDNTQDSTSSYNGFSVTATDAANHSRTSKTNALGQVIETIDDAGTKTQFTYNQNGHRIQVKNAVGTAEESTVTYVVDKLGRQIAMQDPDHGIYTYGYDALGQKILDISPKLAAASQSISFQYDLLGRMTSRTEPEGTTTWSYDNTTGGNKGIGKLHSESQSGFSRTYAYAGNNYGLLTGVTTAIGGNSYTTAQSYNGNGQIDTLTYPASADYPGGLQVQNTYNALGYLERVQNPGNSEVYYQYLQGDAAGRMTQQWLGDGSTLNQAYQAHSNRITSQHTTLGGAGIQQLSYAWDSSGNMSSRSDLLNGLSESFTYDNLDRLTAAQVGAATAKDYGYSIVGNLIEKSDVGDYSYNLVQPHAVGQISQGGNTNDYAYDTNGNLNSGDDLPSLTWASYNKPTQIQKNGITYNFKYGPDRLRYQKTHSSGGTTTTTHYLGNFEQSSDGTTTTYRHHIRAGERVIAVLTDDGNSIELKYLHRDHLGSVTAITDTSGALIERLSYDPWGQRRSATDWETIITTATDHRGYTGHEHLDDVGLIHMNGRVYSPKLGRMLSPDPVTQAPNNGQNYNRYSYVLNNPLKGGDPSGYAGPEEYSFNPSFNHAFPSNLNHGPVSPLGSLALPGESTLEMIRVSLVFGLGPVLNGTLQEVIERGPNADLMMSLPFVSNWLGLTSSSNPTSNQTPDDSGKQGVVGVQISFGDGFTSEQITAFQSVTNTYFKDVFPDGHQVNVLLRDLGGKNVMETPNQNTILINTRSINFAPINILQAAFGHELIHVQDHVKYGNISEGSIAHFESEVRGLEWEFKHQTDFHYSLEDSSDLTDRLVDARNDLKRAKQLEDIQNQFNNFRF